MGYQSVFINQKTSLKKECTTSDCLSSEFDNIWYKKDTVKITNSKVIHFYKDFQNLKQAQKISDHIPITVEIK
jgi:hypothetical protein